MDDFITADYETSIKFQYNLDQRVIAQAINTGLMHSYLSEVNKGIV